MAVVNFSKAFMGASSFELPWAFAQAGLVGGTVGTILFAIASNACFSMLVRLGALCATEAQPNPSYPEIGRACGGRPGEVFVWFGMVSMTIGVCGSYLVFIGGTLSQLFGPEIAPQSLCTLLAAFPAAGLSSLRTTRMLSYTSALGLIATFIACTFVCVEALERQASQPGEVAPPLLMRWRTYPLFLGNAGEIALA